MRGIMLGMAALAGWPVSVGIAQSWPDKNTATPDLVQTDFGPNGAALPFDGADYCGPTAAAMALGYLNNAGFTQLLGANPTDADYLNLVRVLAGLASASDSQGSLASNVLDATDTFLRAKGFGPAGFAISPSDGGYHRTIAEIATENTGPTALIGLLGWYDRNGSDYVRYGGHFFTITGQSVGSPGSLSIHNPFPNALLDQPNLPAYVPQTLPMADLPLTETNSGLPTGTYLQFAANQVGVGPALGTQAVVEQIFSVRIDPSQLPNNGFVPQEWTIDAPRTLDPGAGTLTVETTVGGAGGLTKKGSGNLVFRRAVSLTGDHTVEAGALVSEVTTGDAFGTGSVALTDLGQLAIRPAQTALAPVQVAAASRPNAGGTPGARVTFSGGNAIELDRGGNAALVVTLGGNSGNDVANLAALGPTATLVLRADDLGGSEKLRVNGNGANLPAVTNGSVGPRIIGASGTDERGAFLTYDVTDGFRAATTTGGDLNAATSTTLYRATTAQTLTGPVSVATLAVENVTIGGAGQTLQVGPQDAGAPAGVIFNGGRIVTGGLAFGGSPALLYASRDGGAIDAPITGTGGLVKFGPGDLNLGAASPGLTGGVEVQTGSLTVAAAGALGGGGNPVNVLAGASLRVEGAGSVAGPISATANSAVVLVGGTIGTVNLASTGPADAPVQGATLSGSGTITGDVFLDGYLAADRQTQAGTLTINGLVSPGTGAAFIWSLPSLVDDNSGGVAGTNWNNLVLTNADATFGAPGQTISLFFDFAVGLDPSGGNAFWNTDHRWTLFEFTGRDSAAGRANLDFPSASFPAGAFSYAHDGNKTVLSFTAVPEPGSLALLALGLGALLAARRHRAARPGRS